MFLYIPSQNTLNTPLYPCSLHPPSPPPHQSLSHSLTPFLSLSLRYKGTAFVKFDSPASAQACVQFASVGDDSEMQNKGIDKGGKEGLKAVHGGSVGGVSSSEVGLMFDDHGSTLYIITLCHNL